MPSVYTPEAVWDSTSESLFPADFNTDPLLLQENLVYYLQGLEDG